jgi:hypothetical protein
MIKRNRIIWKEAGMGTIFRWVHLIITIVYKMPNRLRVSENRVQRRIFQPKSEEVAGPW